MRTNFLLLVGMLLLAACSSPKYSYHFDHYDYNSGKKEIDQNSRLAINPIDAPAFASEARPLSITEETLEASAQPRMVRADNTTSASTSLLAKKYSSMTKSEKKEFKKEVRNEVKKYLKGKKNPDTGASVDATKVMDYNLKMAIIFGAIAIVLSFFGGANSIFWILSVVALVVGVVFFVKWLAEQ